MLFMKPAISAIILLCFLPVLFLWGVTPSHAAVIESTTPVRSAVPALMTHGISIEQYPTAVTLARVQVTPAYPLFGIIGSLSLIALIFMYRVYRSI
jgi:hypothetical protein